MVHAQYYALSQAGAHPASNHGCKKCLRMISKLSNRWRLVLLGATIALIIVIVAYLCLALAYMAAVLWKVNRLPDRIESNINLYKNTSFEACMLSPSPQVNCSAFTEETARIPSGSDYNGWLNHPGNWCDVVSCFSGWEVVPSTPRDSAFGLTCLLIWTQLYFTAPSVF